MKKICLLSDFLTARPPRSVQICSNLWRSARFQKLVISVRSALASSRLVSFLLFVLSHHGMTFIIISFLFTIAIVAARLSDTHP